MNITTAFADVAASAGAKTALFWGDREITYGELREQSRAVALRLRDGFGVRPGDRVGVWLKNCPEFVAVLFGVLEAGAVFVPINNFLKPAEVGFILGDAGVDVLVTEAELAPHFPALAELRPGLRLLRVEDPAEPAGPGSDADLPGTARLEGDLAVLIYTSGTTGRPKGAMLSHGNLLHNVESCRLILQIVPFDRFVVMLPMFHSYMLTVGLLLPLLVGGSILLIKSLHPVRNLLAEIISRKASILPAIPQFYRSLVAAPGVVQFPLRLCVSGAAPLPVQILKEFEAKFQIPLIEGYGLSEASPVVTKNPLDGTRKPGSIGQPVPNVEVSIQDEEGNLLGPDEIGELCVRGGNVMLGYWNQPDETARVMRHGWLLTGDIGRRDIEGFYYITDRKKDMLLVNGINVYPREIEEILYQFPGVKEAAVIGKPDARRGEQPVAFVSPADGVSLDETTLLQFVREHLADYKTPRHVVFLPALPRNATGKVLKTALRQMEIEE